VYGIGYPKVLRGPSWTLLYSETETILDQTSLAVCRRRPRLTDQPASSASLLSSIAAVLQALAWPAVAALLLIMYRSRIGSLLDVLTEKLAAATKLKAWQLELETTEQEIKEVVDKTGEAASSEALTTKIPENQLKAAQEVNQRLLESPLSVQRSADVVQRQLRTLVEEYERIRKEMPRGQMRTRVMNEVAAKMRTLALAARPLLRSFMLGQTAGERLVAICILQVVPEFGFLPWLIERIKSEDQPFVFFQAGVAVLELVHSGAYPDKARMRESIEDAIQHISSFKGGPPDQNTIDVLRSALSLVK